MIWNKRQVTLPPFLTSGLLSSVKLEILTTRHFVRFKSNLGVQSKKKCENLAEHCSNATFTGFNPFLFSRSCSHVKEICLPNHAQAIRDHSSSITEQKVIVLENAMSRCFQVVLSYSCMEKSPLRGMFSPDEHKKLRNLSPPRILICHARDLLKISTQKMFLPAKAIFMNWIIFEWTWRFFEFCPYFAHIIPTMFCFSVPFI